MRFAPSYPRLYKIVGVRYWFTFGLRYGK